MDIDAATWTVPGARTKTGDEHRVALSGRTLEILEAARSLAARSGLIFPNTTGRQLSNNTMRKLLIDLNIPAVPHGFRASFRSWCADTGVPAKSPKPHSDTSSPASPAPTSAATSSTDAAPSWTNGPPTSELPRSSWLHVASSEQLAQYIDDTTAGQLPTHILTVSRRLWESLSLGEACRIAQSSEFAGQSTTRPLWHRPFPQALPRVPRDRVPSVPAVGLLGLEPCRYD